MALAWKAGWVHALAGSNPASSAHPDQAQRRAPSTDRGRATPSRLRSQLASLDAFLVGPQQASDLGRNGLPDRVGRHADTVRPSAVLDRPIIRIDGPLRRRWHSIDHQDSAFRPTAERNAPGGRP